MVLCQVYVNLATRTLYDVKLFGKKKVKIVKIDCRSTNVATNAPVHYFIRMQSSILRLPYGNFPYLLFHSNPVYQVGNVHGDLEFEANFVGNLDIEIFDHDTGEHPLYFLDMVLHLDVTDIE